MDVALIVLLPFLGACVPPLTARSGRNVCAGATAAVTLAALLLLLARAPAVFSGQVIAWGVPWVPQIGLSFSFFIDGLGLFFAALILGIGLLIILYARFYLSREDPIAKFYAFLLLFQGAMVGIVLSDNLLLLIVFWELTSLTSFLLIGYWRHLPQARQGARMALLVTGGGGLALIGGMLILGQVAGSYQLSEVLARGAVVQTSPLYVPALLLILIAAFTKSAHFPFHFWLPHAMAAPTPVSAYLHSATMVKAGVFLMARLWPVLSGTEEWFWIVGSIGICSLVVGAYAAMFHDDLKGLLAYSTISHLGLITLLLGLNSPLAAVAAVFHMMNHATFKASLFMAAGIIDHETGTRDVRRLNGLFKVMPITATLALVASAAMAGVPLLNGFLSKEMFFAETVYISSLPWVEFGLPLVAMLAGIFAVVYSLRFSVDIFFGPLSADLPRTPHEPPRWMRVPVELLVFACLVVGVAPALSVAPFLAAAALPVVGDRLPQYSLSLWHGFNAPMIMSLVAITGGISLYLWLRRRRTQDSLSGPPLMRRVSARRLFESALVGLGRIGRLGLRMFGTRHLQTQLFSLVCVAFVVALAPMWANGLTWGDRPRLPGSIVF